MLNCAGVIPETTLLPLLSQVLSRKDATKDGSWFCFSFGQTNVMKCLSSRS